MYGTPASPLGRWDEAPSPRGGAGRSRPGRGPTALLALVMAAVALGLPAPSPAQVPGPESFAREPRTPEELWNAIDYLARTGQAAKATPYLDRFLAANPDDATLVALRDRFGAGSFLRLSDHPATARYAQPLLDRLNAAVRRYATRPDRLARSVAALTGSPDEQDYGVARLREAGAEAVPAVVEAIRRARPGDEDRARLVRNLGRLDASAVPPLVAVLDSPDAQLAAAAADALGRIGDPRAIPSLTYPAAAGDAPPALRDAARTAIERLTGAPFAAQPTPPARVLADAAWRYHRHEVEFPGDPVIVWTWDRARNAPAPQTMRRGEAEELFGKRLAAEALRLQPGDPDARTALVSLTLERAADRAGFGNVPARDPAAFATAREAGLEILARVIRTATADGKTGLAAVAVTALGSITDPARLADDIHPHPLVEALAAPSRRVQFAAARALVNLKANGPYPGSSRLVPTLARFASAQPTPHAVVIDGNPLRGSQLAGFLRELGYETAMERTGAAGFEAAAGTADVELVLVSHALDYGPWDLIDTLTNLRSDPRTARLPVYIYGPLALRLDRRYLTESFPGVRFLVQPLDAATLERLMGGRPARLPDDERAAYAREAASLLAQLAEQPHSPYALDLAAAEPALTIALSQPETGLAASSALGEVPLPDAQRALGDAILDPSRAPELRRNGAERLARSIRRFGPLVSADQEVALASEMQAAADPRLREALGRVVEALRAHAPAGRRSTRVAPARPAAPEARGTPAPAVPPAPAAAPSPAPTARPRP